MQQRFSYRNVKSKDLPIIHRWLKLPHIAEWIHGNGLKNTLNGLYRTTRGIDKINRYWLASENNQDFGFLIAAPIEQKEDEFKSVKFSGNLAISLDTFIGNVNFLGKGLATLLIADFLLSQFTKATDFVIDPEKSNRRAIHVYEKVGFKTTGEFIAPWHPVPHLMMHVNRDTLRMVNND